MAIGVGFDATLGYITETTWGTWKAVTKGVKIVSEDLRLVDPPQPRKSLGQPTQLDFYQGRKHIEGTVDMELMYSGMEAFLYNAMGTVTDAGSPNYTHTYKIVDPLPTGLSLELRQPPAYYRFEGMKINTMTLTMTDLEVLRCVFDFVGEDQYRYTTTAASGSTSGISFPTDDPILPFTDSNYNFAVTVGGAAVTGGIREATVTLNNALAGDRPNLGSRTIQEPVRNDFINVTGQLVTDLRTESIAEFYQDFVAGATAKINLKYNKDANTSLEVNIPAAYYSGETPPTPGPGVLTMTIPFQARYHSGSATAMEVLLKNQTADGATG